MPKGRNSPLYCMYKAERVSSQFESQNLPRRNPCPFDLQEANGPDVDAELLIHSADVHGGHVHNGESRRFLCPVFKHCLPPVTVGSLRTERNLRSFQGKLRQLSNLFISSHIWNVRLIRFSFLLRSGLAALVSSRSVIIRW